MSPRYAFCFIALGAVLGVEAVLCRPFIGNWSLVLVYPAVSFLLLGVAYAGVGSSLLRKRSNGCLPWTTVLLFGPYFVVNEITWRLLLRLSREPIMGLAAPNLFFGRRLTASDVHLLESCGLRGCLDLTSEYTETRALRLLPQYRCLHLLDATAPTIDQLRDTVNWLRQTTDEGSIYVHCALGHGRTGTIVIAYLLTIGQVATIEDGLAQLRGIRSGVGINRRQEAVLRQFLVELRGKTHHPASPA